MPQRYKGKGGVKTGGRFSQAYLEEVLGDSQEAVKSWVTNNQVLRVLRHFKHDELDNEKRCETMRAWLDGDPDNWGINQAQEMMQLASELHGTMLDPKQEMNDMEAMKKRMIVFMQSLVNAVEVPSCGLVSEEDSQEVISRRYLIAMCLLLTVIRDIKLGTDLNLYFSRNLGGPPCARWDAPAKKKHSRLRQGTRPGPSTAPSTARVTKKSAAKKLKANFHSKKFLAKKSLLYQQADADYGEDEDYSFGLSLTRIPSQEPPGYEKQQDGSPTLDLDATESVHASNDSIGQQDITQAVEAQVTFTYSGPAPSLDDLFKVSMPGEGLFVTPSSSHQSTPEPSLPAYEEVVQGKHTRKLMGRCTGDNGPGGAGRYNKIKASLEASEAAVKELKRDRDIDELNHSSCLRDLKKAKRELEGKDKELEGKEKELREKDKKFEEEEETAMRVAADQNKMIDSLKAQILELKKQNVALLQGQTVGPELRRR